MSDKGNMGETSSSNRAATGPVALLPSTPAPSGPIISFGAMCDPLAIQLEQQGWTVSDHAELMRVEIIAKAVATVTIHGLMPHAMSDRARKKLSARVGKIIIPIAVGAAQ